MPIIHVYLKQGTNLDYRHSIARGIQDAMIEVLAVPDDDYNQITHEVRPENMIYDPNYFGVPRSDNVVFIGLTFNHRSPELKTALFGKIVENLTSDPGINRDDIMMNIQEVATDNWWASARTVDPGTGLDSRMAADTPAQGHR